MRQGTVQSLTEYDRLLPRSWHLSQALKSELKQHGWDFISTGYGQGPIGSNGYRLFTVDSTSKPNIFDGYWPKRDTDDMDDETAEKTRLERNELEAVKKQEAEETKTKRSKTMP